MKRIIVVVLAVISLFVGLKTTNALSEEKLKEKMNQVFTVGNAKYKLTEDTKILLERYLNTYDLSETDAQYISDRYDEAVSIIQKAGNVDFKNLPTATKNELKALVEKVSANTSVKATVTKGSVVVYKPDGGVFAEVTKPIKQTGSETNTVAIVASLAFLVTVAGAALVVRQVKSN